MRLFSIKPTRYGCFNENFSINFGAISESGHDFHIVYGPNEAGKSTILHAIKDFFFGMELKSLYNFQHDYTAMRIDAEIELEGKIISLQRIKKVDGLRNTNDLAVPKAVLGASLLELERDTYCNMFCLNDESLVLGGKSILQSKGELGQLLFSAASGLSDVGTKLEELQKKAEELFGGGKRSSTVKTLISELNDLTDNNCTVDMQVGEYEKLQKISVAKEDEYLKEKKECEKIEKEFKRLNCIYNSISDWHRRNELLETSEKISNGEKIILPPYQWYDQVSLLSVEDVEFTTKYEILIQTISFLKDEISNINPDNLILGLEYEIDFLNSNRGLLGNPLDNIENLNQLNLFKTEASDILQKLGLNKNLKPSDFLLPEPKIELFNSLCKKYDSVYAKFRVENENLIEIKTQVSEVEKEILKLKDFENVTLINSKLKAYTDRYNELKRDKKDLSLSINASKIQFETKNAKTKAIEYSTAQISDEYSEKVRLARDNAWRAHKNALENHNLSLKESAIAFETSLNIDDEVKMNREMNFQDVLTSRILKEEIKVINAELEEKNKLLLEIQFKEAILTKEIVGSLKEVLIDFEGNDSLDILLDVFTAYHLESNLKHAELKLKVNFHEKLFKDLSKTQNLYNSADNALREWQTNLDSGLKNSWICDEYKNNISKDALSVTELEVIIKLVSVLSLKVKNINELEGKITKQKIKQEAFLESLKTVCQKTLYVYIEDKYNEIIHDLFTKLSKARSEKDELSKKKSLLENYVEEQKILEDNLQRISTIRKEMELFLNVEGFINIQNRLIELQRYQESQNEIVRLEKSLIEMLECASIDEAVSILTQYKDDRISLKDELESLEKLIQSKSDEVTNLYLESHNAKNKLNFQNDDLAARLIEERNTKLLDIKEHADQYLRLRFGIKAAEYALEKYRAEHQSAMLEQTEKIFASITQGKYTRLSTQTDKNRELLIAKEKNKGSKTVDQMSKGTAMQLYLALRIAGYYEYTKQRDSLPFIADDILETFDDNRAVETFKLLHTLSSKGQVIYLTHHEHLCEIAESICGKSVSIHKIM